MKAIKVADATNTQLDWLAAKCEGLNPNTDYHAPSQWGLFPGWREANGFGYAIKNYTTDWSQMGRIIEREGIDISLDRDRVFDPDEKVERWYASKPSDTTTDAEWTEYGPTPLIAAARCYVTSKLGEIVEVPEELT